jgi:transposase
VSRYRLIPTTAQEAALRQHCAHARFVWNLAVEQQSWWRRGRTSAPRYLDQSRQLTAARRENDWLAAGSQIVNPACTSQRCSACGHVDRNSRESQAQFRCTSCGYASHADVNAAINIAAGHAVTARRGDRATGPVKREPQHHGLRVA